VQQLAALIRARAAAGAVAEPPAATADAAAEAGEAA
jgi:hypothetical protein